MRFGAVPDAVRPTVLPNKAVNAPRMVNFTGVPEGMGGNPYYGGGLEQIEAQRQQLAEAAGYPLSAVKEPFGGAAYMVDKLGTNLRDSMALKAEAATRDRLSAIMGGIDLDKGPTQQDIEAAYAVDPEYGKALYAQAVAARGKEQWEPYGDGLQRNTVTGEIKKTGAAEEGGGAWKPSDIGSLRDDYTKAAGTFSSANQSWQSMKEAAKLSLSPEGTAEGKGAADYNMIVAFAKLLDPNSVVREGEVKSAAMTEGELAGLQGWLNQWKMEGTLSDDVRRAIMVQANSRMKGYYDDAKSKRDWIVGIATRHGVNPDDVVPPMGEFGAWETGQDQPPARKTEAVTMPDGSSMDLPVLDNGDIDYDTIKKDPKLLSEVNKRSQRKP